MHMLTRSSRCTATVKMQQIYRPANAAALVAKFLAVDGVSVAVATIDGVDALESDAHRQWLVKVLSGGDVSSLPVPICAAAAAAAAKPPPKPRAPKKKAEQGLAESVAEPAAPPAELEPEPEPEPTPDPKPRARAPKKEKVEEVVGQSAAPSRKRARPAPKAAAVDSGESSAEEID